jgi:hypothetical protein
MNFLRIVLLSLMSVIVVGATGCEKDDTARAIWTAWLKNLITKNPRAASAGDKIVFLSVPPSASAQDSVAVKAFRQGFGGLAIAYDVRDAAELRLLFTHPVPKASRLFEGPPRCVLLYPAPSGGAETPMGALPSACDARLELGEWNAASCDCGAFSALMRAVQ